MSIAKTIQSFYRGVTEFELLMSRDSADTPPPNLAGKTYMKTCQRCGRNLDKTGHSLTCPVGRFIQKIDEGKGDESIRIAFPNDELKARFGEMMARTAQAMTATKTFFDACVEMDEDAPDLTAQIAAPLEKFTTDLILIYPNSDLFDADLNTLLGKIES